MQAQVQVDVFDADGGTLIDPLTGCIFVDPVIAGDKYTYSRAGAISWIRFSDEKGIPLTSPKTQQKMSRILVPDTEKAVAVEKVSSPFVIHPFGKDV